MQARFYLPMWGRFASPDPARDQHFEETQSWNIYSYVQNNPVMMTDPTGMVAGDAVPWYLGGDSAFVDKALNFLHTVTVKANPGYQMLAVPADLLGATINATAKQDIPMSSNLGQAAENGASTTEVLVNHSLDVPMGIVEMELGGKAIEGVAGALGKAEARLLGEAPRASYEGIAEPKVVEPGRDFSRTQKQALKAENAQRNGGVMRSDGDGRLLRPSTQSRRGVTPHPDEAQVDHIRPKARGGTNSSRNARVISREENLKKGAKLE